jgi:hypothetical protein
MFKLSIPLQISLVFVRGDIQINPECICFSAADSLTRNNMKIKKHHVPILYHFCFNQYGHRMYSQLPTVPQISDVSTTPAKTAKRRAQYLFTGQTKIKQTV